MITISEVIKKTEIPMKLGILTCNVSVQESSEEFVAILNDKVKDIETNQTMENYKTETLEASRRLYRKLGKDPSRYRISSDSLMRRIIKGKGIYYVNNVVDINNLISLETLWSIGAYDLDKVKGSINYDVGVAADIYEGIGRGVLNIENLPVLKDEIGPFGSATSDSLRTMVTEQTERLMMVIHAFGDEEVDRSLNELADYLKRFAKAVNVHVEIIE